MNKIQWAKQNKAKLVAGIVNGVVPSPGHDTPIAVFAAGVPGAGKTEFLDRLLAKTENIVRVDMDEIVKLFPGYKPESYYKFRGAASIIVDEVVIYCRKHRLDFVLDGTFGSERALDNVRSALKRHKVLLYYVWKEPVLAWQHTKDRQVVTKRGIDKNGFIVAYEHVPANLLAVREKFGEKISFAAIRKDPDSDSFQMTENDEIIDELLKMSYTKEDLERILL